jgi:hypothetical protein
MSEEDVQAPRNDPKPCDFRGKLIEVSPIIAVVVLVLALAIGFVARDVAVNRGSLGIAKTKRRKNVWLPTCLGCWPVFLK